MNKGLIGVQMMMLRGKVEELGVYETLHRLAEMGYHCVEVSQIPMTAENVDGMKRACGDFGIKIAALSASLEPMRPGMPGEFLCNEEDFNKIVNDCKTLDCQFLRIGMLPISYMNSREDAIEFARRCDAAAEKLKAHGIDLYYHNHHVEFRKYDGVYLLDLIRENARHIGFELDVHWIQRGGENPIRIIKEYAGLVKLLHLKDYRIGALDMEALGKDPKAFMQVFSGVVQFAEVGEGNLPMKEIIEAGLESGSEYFLIEQDDQYGRDPFGCLQISHDNLCKLGFADWFNL